MERLACLRVITRAFRYLKGLVYYLKCLVQGFRGAILMHGTQQGAQALPEPSSLETLEPPQLSSLEKVEPPQLSSLETVESPQRPPLRRVLAHI